MVKVFYMKATQHTGGEMYSVKGNIHLFLDEEQMRLAAEKSEEVIREIRSRATEVGSVLEGILTEPHDIRPWHGNK